MEMVQAVKKLNSISREWLNFRRRPILCTTLYRNPMQATNFGSTFDQLFLRIFLYNFHRRSLSISSIPWCKKVKNDQKLKSRGGPALRHHYWAGIWTFDENSFLVSSESSIWNGSMGENRQKEFHCEVGLKCHQSYIVALAFCTKLYIKLAFSLCSFSQFSFPFNFWTAEALVLKFGSLPLHHLFSNTLLAIFDIFFRSRVIDRFVPKNGPNLTCGRVF